MKNKIELENYEFVPRSVRIKGEDVYLFCVQNDSDYNRSKKDADKIAEDIVTRYNGHDALLEENERLRLALHNCVVTMETIADSYNIGIGERTISEAKEALNPSTIKE